MAELRARQARMGNGAVAREDREAMRRVVHSSLIDKYAKLIPNIKYKKNKEIDEFNTPECVICMEIFEVGADVRKVPSCRHIFHDDCLMKWLSGAQMQEAQKCPMCNSDITVAILEKAIEEESTANKGGGFLGGVFGRSSPKKNVRPPVAPAAGGGSRNDPSQVVAQ